MGLSFYTFVEQTIGDSFLGVIRVLSVMHNILL